MKIFFSRLYGTSWGAALIWLGISIVINRYFHLDLLGMFLLGVGIYGVTLSLFLSIWRRGYYIIYLTLSLVCTFIGLIMVFGWYGDWGTVMGVLLIIFGIGVIVHNLYK